jgi:hypothetical protein
MKKSMIKFVVHTVSCGNEVMYTQSKQEALNAVSQLLSYVGLSITVTSTIRSKKWWGSLTDWDGWKL